MAYNRTIWEDSPSTSTPITADRLNNMESGIQTAYNTAEKIKNADNVYQCVASYDATYNAFLTDISEFDIESVKSGDVFVLKMDRDYDVPKPSLETIMFRVNTNVLVGNIININTSLEINENDVLYIMYSKESNIFIPLNLDVVLDYATKKSVERIESSLDCMVVPDTTLGYHRYDGCMYIDDSGSSSPYNYINPHTVDKEGYTSFKLLLKPGKSYNFKIYIDKADMDTFTAHFNKAELHPKGSAEPESIELIKKIGKNYSDSCYVYDDYITFYCSLTNCDYYGLLYMSCKTDRLADSYAYYGVSTGGNDDGVGIPYALSRIGKMLWHTNFALEDLEKNKLSRADLKEYALKSDIPSEPSDIGAEPSGATEAHNTNIGSHNDIRLLISSSYNELKGDLAELNELTIAVIVSDNNFDSVFDESGYIDNSGINQASTTFKRTSKYYELIQGEDDKVYVYTSEQNPTITVMLYDENKNYINQIGCNNIDSNSKIVPLARYFRVYTRTAYDGNLYISRTVQGADVNYEYKRKRFIDESTLPLPFGKKTIVNFGDSMFGNFRDYTSISNYLSKLNGATVYNVGFGGCLMAQRYISGVSESSNNAWSAFSMYNLASAICTQDFTMQDTYKNYGTTELNKLPDYFSAQVDVLKSIDFTKVDIITIAYGTNDWTNNRPIDDTENGFDITTYIGALKQSIKLIQQTYPMIKILVITPIWRWFSDGSDSDSKEYTYGTLVDYKNALVTACKKMRVPVLDSYESLSLSMYNKDTYFEDYTHLNSLGRHMYAELIDGALRLLY